MRLNSRQHQNSITVKGLAEKPIQADSARWEINLQTNHTSPTIPEAYQLLDHMKELQSFFVEHGFKAENMQFGNKSSQPYYEEVNMGEGRINREFKGYMSITILGSIVVISKRLNKRLKMLMFWMKKASPLNRNLNISFRI